MVSMEDGSLTELYKVGADFLPISVAAVSGGVLISMDVLTDRVATVDAEGRFTLRYPVGFDMGQTPQSFTHNLTDSFVYRGAVTSAGYGGLVTTDPDTYAIASPGEMVPVDMLIRPMGLLFTKDDEFRLTISAYKTMKMRSGSFKLKKARIGRPP